MISSQLNTLSSELRKAAGRGAYVEVERLAARVGAAAAEQAGALPPGDPEIPEIAEWLNHLFDRTEILVRIARATQAGQLRQVTFLRRYLPPAIDCSPHVKLAL